MSEADVHGEQGPLPWNHPDVRTCGHCGHKRDVHGAYRASNGGFRCNLLGGCDCQGFQSVAALSARSLDLDRERDEAELNGSMDRGEGMQ